MNARHMWPAALTVTMLCGCGPARVGPAGQDQAIAEKNLGTWEATAERGATLVELFAASGARVRIVRLTSTDPRLDSGPHEYEAEVEFLNDCQLKEGRAAYWSPAFHPGGGTGDRNSPIRQRGEPSVTRFKQGERHVIRGIIDIAGWPGSGTGGGHPLDAPRRVPRDRNRIEAGP